MDEAASILSSIRLQPCADFTNEINKFQLRPTLLDPVLAEIMHILTAEFLRSGNSAPLDTIYVLTRVRGYKHVLQHFPVTLDLAPKSMSSIEAVSSGEARDGLTKTLSHESNLDITKSPASTVDPKQGSSRPPIIVDAFAQEQLGVQRGHTTENNQGKSSESSEIQDKAEVDWKAQYVLLSWVSCLVLAPFDLALVGPDSHNRLSKLCSPLLSVSGIQRDAAALSMARLSTRSRTNEADQAISAFYQERLEHGNSASGKLGMSKVLAIIMDRVSEPPTCVRNISAEVMEAAENDDDSISCQYISSGSGSFLKILGRSALKDPDTYAEFAIMELIAAFEDRSTNVRTTAAKYLARIAQQIAHNLSDDIDSQETALSQVWETVVDPMLECVDISVASPDYWGAALFAVAELIRRLPSHFWSSSSGKSALVEFIFSILQNSGLHFIQGKLKGQGGATVRDTACYVCWSIFRYIPNLAVEVRDSLFDSLMALAISDAEVHVRRAAAAALQEGLGRQAQSIPQKRVFEIMEHVNFHSVNQISRCYLDILPRFWQIHWIPWFLTHGCFHHNPDNRRLAATAAPLLLTPLSPAPGHSNFLTKSSSTSSSSSFSSLTLTSSELNTLNCSKRNDTSTELINLLMVHEHGSTGDLHGKYLTLSLLFVAGNHHRQDEMVDLVETPSSDDSELIFEAMLSLSVVSLEKGIQILEKMDLSNLETKNKNTGRSYTTRETPSIRAAKLLVSQIGSQRVINICIARMKESSLFVACLVTLNEKFAISSQTVEVAMKLSSPESRAWACKLITSETAELLLPALNDYATDKRGDVGSWVREAALKRIAGLMIRGDKYEDIIWRLAAENNQRIREVAAETLVKLEIVPSLILNARKRADEEEKSSSKYRLNDFSSALFYEIIECCPLDRRQAIVSGLVSSIGGSRGSAETLTGSFNAVARQIREHRGILDHILAINRKEASVRTSAIGSTYQHGRVWRTGADITRAEVMRTLKRLVLGQVPFVPESRPVLAIAFNTTLVRGVSESVMLDAIDIIQAMADLDLSRVRLRLINILRGHSNGRIRQRAADAVYELDLAFGRSRTAAADAPDPKNDVLVTVDWTRSDYHLFIKYLN